MNENDTTTVEETVIPTETTEETVTLEAEQASADPVDAVEDVDELRRMVKAQRSIANRYKKNPPASKSTIIKAESKYNILEDEVADLILSGYTKDETKFILANGGRKQLDNKDSYVAIAINAKRDQRKTEDAVSQTSSKGYVSGGKTYTEADLKNMTPEEMMKVLPQA